MKRMVDNNKFEELESKAENIGLNEYIINMRGKRSYYCNLVMYVSNDDGDKEADIDNYVYIPIKTHITEDMAFHDRDELREWLVNNLDTIVLNQITYDSDNNAYKNTVISWSPSSQAPISLSVTINNDPSFYFDWDGNSNYIGFTLIDSTTGFSVGYEE